MNAGLITNLTSDESNKLFIQWTNPSGFFDILNVSCSAQDDLLNLNNTSLDLTRVNISRSILSKNETNAALDNIIAGLRYSCLLITVKTGFNNVFSEQSSVYTSKYKI